MSGLSKLGCVTGNQVSLVTLTLGPMQENPSGSAKKKVRLEARLAWASFCLPAWVVSRASVQVRPRCPTHGQLPTLAAVKESASSEPASSSRSDQVSGQGKLREPRS